MINTICYDCGHRHRGVAQCKFCDCCWEQPLILEDSKMKKLWDKFVAWLFSWQK